MYIFTLFCLTITAIGFIMFWFAAQAGVGLKVAIVGMLLVIGGVIGATMAENSRPYVTTPAHSWDTTTIQNITSLSDDSGFSVSGRGAFILGSGYATVKGNSYHEYVFYKVTPDGFVQGTLNTDGVILKEDENTYPYIEWDYSHTTSELKTYPDDGSTWGGWQTDSLTKTVIHVPNGTIVKEYKL